MLLILFLGHATLMGVHTKKVVSYTSRTKVCRKCDAAARRHQTPPAHDCRRNWSGSAKAMEPAMVSSMVQDVEASHMGIKVGALVGDDDASINAKVREEVRPTIKK